MKLDLTINVTQTGSGFTTTVSGIHSVSEAADRAGGGLTHMGERGREATGWLSAGVAEMTTAMLASVSVVALAEKGMELFGEAVNFTKEAIGHADFIRDLELSLQAYTKSAATATQVIEYFREEQVRTRNTAEELQQSFRNLNPLASTKGFTVGAQEQITVMLSQVATAANKSLSEIESGYRRVLSGVTGGASRNALLQVLGISKEQLANMGWDQFLAKLQEAAKRSDEFGQSWESTMHKAKESLLNSFAEGFNEARRSSVEGMDAISAAVADPRIKEALHDFGVATAEWAGILGGVLTEMRGISHELHSIGTDPGWAAIGKILEPTIKLFTLGYVRDALGLVGQLGIEQQKAQAEAASIAAGRSVVEAAGINVGPKALHPWSSPLAQWSAFQSMAAPQADFSTFKGGTAQLEKMIGDVITADKITGENLKVFTAELRAGVADAIKERRPFTVVDINEAAARAMTGGIEGAPHGRVSGPVAPDKTAELESQTKQLLAQAAVLDLQNQKMDVQAQIGEELRVLGEKKTGLDDIQLDAATKQLLAQHEINALRVVDLDKQIEMTKATSEYQTTLDKIKREQAADAAKPGGGTISAATFDAERQAAAKKYASAVDEINGKTRKGLQDAAGEQTKLTHSAQEMVLARTEELTKVRALVAEQGAQNDVLASQLEKAKAQGQLAAIELALQTQHVSFGATSLDQQTDSLLKQHEALDLQQTQNDTEIAMQEERKRAAKEQADTAAKVAAQIAAGYTGEGVNPEIDQLTLLALQQRVGSETKIQQVQAEGHAKTMAAIKSEADLRNQAIDQATKGYIGMADMLASATHDAFAAILDGGDMKHMLEGLVSGYRTLLNDTLDGVMKQYLKAWQQMAQGTINPQTGQMGHVDATTGQWVATSTGQQKTAQVAMTATQGAAALYSTYQSAQAGASPGTNAVSGFASGAALFSAAGPYGMVVGGLIGAAYGAVFSAIAEGSKARFQLTVGSDGRISVEGFGKATSANVDAAMRQLNDTVSSAANAVRGIIDAFPIAIASQLSGLGKLAPGTLGTDVEKVRTFAISIFKKSFAGGFTADELQHFMTEELPKILLDAALPTINEGLKELGVNAAKIASLGVTAEQDPSKAFQFINDYVTGFVAMRDSIDFLGKSAADKTAAAMGIASPVFTDQLQKANENIAYLGKGFDQLSNTEQVDRLKQINAAIAERTRLEEQVLVEINNAKKAVATSYADAQRGYAMAAASPEEQINLLLRQRGIVGLGLEDQINRNTRQVTPGAKTPAEVTAIAEQYANLTKQIYDAAKSLRDSFQAILDSFKALDDKKAADKLAAMDPSAQLAEIASRSRQIAANFASMTDSEKLANSQKLIDYANQYYEVQKQALLDLKNAASSIHDSIAKQIFGIQFDQQKENPQAQLEMLLGQNRTLYASIAGAKTAAEVDAIIAQIQSNVTQIQGLEGNTSNAAADAIKALQAAETAAQAQIALLQQQAIANDDAITAAIKGVGDSVTSTIATLNALMTQATNDLIAFGATIQAKLNSFVDDMQKSDAALLLTLQPIFDALGASAIAVGGDLDNIGGPGGKLPGFEHGLDDATNALARFAAATSFGPGSGFSSAAFSSPTSTFAPQVNVNIGGDIAPFVTMVQVIANNEIDKRRTQDARFARSGAGL